MKENIDKEIDIETVRWVAMEKVREKKQQSHDCFSVGAGNMRIH